MATCTTPLAARVSLPLEAVWPRAPLPLSEQSSLLKGITLELPIFVNKSLLETTMLMYLRAVYGCLHTITLELIGVPVIPWPQSLKYSLSVPLWDSPPIFVSH